MAKEFTEDDDALLAELGVEVETKKEAVRKTIEIAKKQQDSQVIIHKQDGKIQEERTYGNDPHPPKG